MRLRECACRVGMRPRTLLAVPACVLVHVSTLDRILHVHRHGALYTFCSDAFYLNNSGILCLCVCVCAWPVFVRVSMPVCVCVCVYLCVCVCVA